MINRRPVFIVRPAGVEDVDHAVGEGWTLAAACQVLKISRRRVERWQQRRTELADRRSGGVAVNSLFGEEIDAS